MKTSGLIIVLFFGIISYSNAQLERVLENTNQAVDLIFHAPRHINLMTVEPLEKKTMHFAIMHTFGTLDGGIENLFGLDNGANIQFSFEFGLSDKLSLGAARSSRDKFYNIYGRYHLLEQTQNGNVPISVSLAGGAGVISNPYSFLPAAERPEFVDRLAYSAQVMIARKFSNKFSLQVSPMLAYFNDPRQIYLIEGTQNLYLAVGFSGKLKVTDRSSLTLQWIPNLNSDLRNNVGIGWDVEAGGHVFQMYFVTSQALNEQYLLAGGNGVPGEEFRLGFNVNRIFALGQKKRK
ncbi:hypothetical protein SAMN03080617_03202 [Algoriphagus alkaliphilus]|uniref:DUF5777 domain-containing protein n=1 Tax=Algoriphagus alkaliphilus TaxID=279824 RepID=A0A1G5Z5Q3_9BACT|nr:DUF5777 family beta-barrel protein [Algoriphagus alkaliphilus]MBA4298668.1 hypothetical protein [Cyclobacterium sp.]SDA89685.1 hypothetical protein SAMN03080617_03202 [Algoriphagus alkaliphilus]